MAEEITPNETPETPAADPTPEVARPPMPDDADVPPPETNDDDGAAGDDGEADADGAGAADAGGAADASAGDDDGAAAGDDAAAADGEPAAPAGATAPKRREVAAPVDPDAADWADYRAKHAALQQKIKDKTYDALEDGASLAELQLQHQDLTNRRLERQEQAASVTNYWSEWGRQNRDVGQARGQDMWQQELDRAQQKYTSRDAVAAVATENFNRRVAAIRAQKKQTPGAATPRTGIPARPVTKGGASVAPKGNPHRPPPAKAKTTDDHYAALAKQGSPLALINEE